MGRFEFVSPGAAMTGALKQFLVEQEAARRQAMLDDMARQREERLLKSTDANIANMEANTESLIEQRNANRLATEQKQFESSHMPGDDVSAEDAKKFPGLVAAGTPVSQGAHLGVDESGVDQYEVNPAKAATFKGTPAQRQAQQQKEAVQQILNSNPELMQHPGIKAAFEYAQATGDHSGLYGAIAQMTKADSDKPKVGTFEDYVVRKFGDNPTPQQIEAARESYRLEQRYAPILIQTQTPGGDATQRIVPRTPGSEFAAGQTSSQKDREASIERVAPFLQGVEELSGRINVKHGAVAKGAGGYRRLMAKVNEDDDVAEYVSLIELFTPLLARAAGHTGVLTEPDYEHTIQALPQPGDSKSLAERKMKRLWSLLGRSEAAPAAPGAGAGKGAPAAPAAPAPAAPANAPKRKRYDINGNEIK